jgi:hypothetical protein
MPVEQETVLRGPCTTGLSFSCREIHSWDQWKMQRPEQFLATVAGEGLPCHHSLCFASGGTLLAALGSKGRKVDHCNNRLLCVVLGG